MVDRDRTPAFDAVSEADLAEQSTPAYPEDPTDERDELGYDADVAGERPARDEWDANPVDVAEQDIAVPFDDDIEGNGGDSTADLVG